MKNIDIEKNIEKFEDFFGTIKVEEGHKLIEEIKKEAERQKSLRPFKESSDVSACNLLFVSDIQDEDFSDFEITEE